MFQLVYGSTRISFEKIVNNIVRLTLIQHNNNNFTMAVK